MMIDRLIICAVGGLFCVVIARWGEDKISVGSMCTDTWGSVLLLLFIGLLLSFLGMKKPPPKKWFNCLIRFILFGICWASLVWSVCSFYSIIVKMYSSMSSRFFALRMLSKAHSANTKPFSVSKKANRSPSSNP